MFVGYARVSTQDQNYTLQIDALEKAGCEKIFKETASGSQRDRPELQKALDYIRSGDILVVWKFDRLARSLKQLLETVEDLEDKNIGLKSITENIDTSSPGGKLVFHIFGGLAEFERSIIKERTKAGLDVARSQGRVGGRPSALSAKDLQAAKAMLKDKKMTVKEVAQQLNISTATLYRYIPGGRSQIEDV